MPQQLTKLSDKDFKLLKKERTGLLGENGPFFPTFGNHIDDFVKFYVYDLNDTYLKYGISEDFQNTDDGIKLNPGNDLRKVGFTRGNYKVKYFFYRRLAGADEVVLTKTVGDESGVVHSGNPQLTGIPMGAFYVDDDGKVFQGEKPPVDGSKPSELDVKEYKFFVDEISADRTEVRLAPQSINLDRYKEEFDDLSNEYGIYTPINEFDNPNGVFNQINETGFNLDPKIVNDQGFKKKFIGGTLEVENAFVIGSTEHTNTIENDGWEIEKPIPTIIIETDYSENNATTDTPVTFTAKRENGNIAPSQLSYYWDFGCGHQEFGGPVITHDYTTAGTMNVSVVINSPNFVDTVIYGPLVVGVGMIQASITEDDTTLEYIPDGSLVQKWNSQTSATQGSIYLIQEGKKRKFSSEVAAMEYLGARGVNIHPHRLISEPGQSPPVYEDVAFDMRPHIRFLDGTVINAIPNGPDFTNDDLAGTSTVQFYTITVEAGIGGAVTGQGNNTTGTSAFEDGSTIYINAEAESGMEFVNWTNEETDSSGNQNTFTDINSSSTSFVLKANSTITANFQAETDTTYYTITVEAGTGGTVTGGGNVEEGSVINISATAGTNYVFSNWTQSGQNSVVSNVWDASTTATANSDATIEANFTYNAPTYTLTLTAGAHGDVSLDGVTWDNSVTGEFAEGSQMVLYAQGQSYPAQYKVDSWLRPVGNNWEDDEEVNFTMPGNNASPHVTFEQGS